MIMRNWTVPLLYTILLSQFEKSSSHAPPSCWFGNLDIHLYKSSKSTSFSGGWCSFFAESMQFFWSIICWFWWTTFFFILPPWSVLCWLWIFCVASKYYLFYSIIPCVSVLIPHMLQKKTHRNKVRLWWLFNFFQWVRISVCNPDPMVARKME